jgi:hypothetical protein
MGRGLKALQFGGMDNGGKIGDSLLLGLMGWQLSEQSDEK